MIDEKLTISITKIISITNSNHILKALTTSQEMHPRQPQR